jgi:hypothetical protein
MWVIHIEVAKMAANAPTQAAFEYPKRAAEAAINQKITANWNDVAMHFVHCPTFLQIASSPLSIVFFTPSASSV